MTTTTAKQYADLGRAAERCGLAWYEGQEMRFQPPADALREEIASLKNSLEEVRAYWRAARELAASERLESDLLREEVGRLKDNLKEARIYWNRESGHAETSEARVEYLTQALDRIRKLDTHTDRFGTSVGQAGRIAVEALGGDAARKDFTLWLVGYRGERYKITVWEESIKARRTIHWASEKPLESYMKLMKDKHGDVLCEEVQDREVGV